MNIEIARFNMIEQQVKPWKVFDERLLGAMATVPRELFVPESHRNLAYSDIPVPLGHNQNMLTPREIARLIQAMQLTGNEKVLEIGCGSGYATALLSKLAKKVFSVDIIDEFVKVAQMRISQLAFSNVLIEEADAADGWLVHAPYDVILITAALPALTENLKRSLKENGRIVAVIGQHNNYSAQVCTLDDTDQWQCETLFPLDAKPMINAEQPNRFVF